MLEVGQKAPDFEVPSTSGEQFHLADALKKHAATVILFYVLDFTPG
jgi:peroxiredoxin